MRVVREQPPTALAPCRPFKSGLRMTRRRALRLFSLLGGAVALQSCGGRNATVQGSVVASPAAPAASATGPTSAIPTTAPTAASPARSPAASPVVAGTPSRAASPTRAAASPPTLASPGPPVAATELLRMLALVPQHPDLPGRHGVWFADAGRQKRNYGFERVDSFAAYQALNDRDRQRFNQVVGRTPHSDMAGQQYGGRLRELTGYDYWQVEREVYAGDPPTVWSRLEGRFDSAAITQALTARDYTTATYRGRSILSRGADHEFSLQHPISRLMLARLNRVALDERAFAAAPTTELIQTGVDAQAGRTPTLGADPDHVAVATALGPVSGAALLAAATFFGQTAPGGDPNRPRLRPYRLVGLALRDDGTTHTMLIALSYAQAADAQAAAPVLRQRLDDYRLQTSGAPLRGRAVPEDPQVVTTGERSVVVQPLAITAEINLWLWVQLLTQRDLRFLAE